MLSGETTAVHANGLGAALVQNYAHRSAEENPLDLSMGSRQVILR